MYLSAALAVRALKLATHPHNANTNTHAHTTNTHTPSHAYTTSQPPVLHSEDSNPIWRSPRTVRQNLHDQPGSTSRMPTLPPPVLCFAPRVVWVRECVCVCCQSLLRLSFPKKQINELLYTFQYLKSEPLTCVNEISYWRSRARFTGPLNGEREKSASKSEQPCPVVYEDCDT
jgi:hypothetical protein